MGVRELLLPWSQIPQESATPNPDLPYPALLIVPGIRLQDASVDDAPSIGGTAPTIDAKEATEAGLGLLLHPSGGSNGYGSLRYRSADGISEDATIIWVGRAYNYTTSNGPILCRGLDGSGNGWNLRLAYQGGTTSTPADLVASVVTTTPLAEYAATVSGLSGTTATHQRIALVRQGGSIKVFDWRTRQSASNSCGTGLRTSTVGIGIATDKAATTAGHQVTNMVAAYPVALSDDAVWALLEDPGLAFEQRRTFFPAPAGGGVAAVIGQVSENESAQPVGARQSRVAGQAAEANAALAMQPRIAASIQQASESDAAQALAAARQARAAGLASETDAALPAASKLTIAAGQAAESDAALAIAARQARAVGQPAETDAAQALLVRQTRTAGQAAEADAAQTFSASLPGTVGQASEADSALAMQPRLAQQLGQAAEANLAQPATLGGTAGTLGQAAEANAAQAFVARLLVGIAQASEADAALGFTPTTVRAIAVAQEANAAMAMASSQLAAIGIAVEFNLAQRVTYPGQDDALSAFWRYDIPGLSLRYDVPGLSLRYDVPSIGAAITVA